MAGLKPIFTEEAMTIESIFKCLCVTLAVLTAITFYYAGPWWSLGAAVVSVVVVTSLVLLGWSIQQRVDHMFKG